MNGDIKDYSGKKIQTQWVGIGNPVFGSGMPGSAITLDGTLNGPYAVAKHSDLLDGVAQASLSLFVKKNQASEMQASAPMTQLWLPNTR